MFSSLTELKRDAIFADVETFKADERAHKKNLGIGIYTTSSGKPFVLPVVSQLAGELDRENFNYQPLLGNPYFLAQVKDLLFTSTENIFTVATNGGTQACALVSELFLTESRQKKTKPVVLIAEPTWGNHYRIFSGIEKIVFPHLDAEGNFHFSSYQRVLENAPEESLLLLHASSAHNPSGKNLSVDHLLVLKDLINSKKIKVLIDAAYLGLAEGWRQDLSWARKAFDVYDHVALATSFSKNATLYEHRTGALSIKTTQPFVLQTHIEHLLRKSVSMASGFGQEVMALLLADHRAEWFQQLETMRLDIISRKEQLLQALDPLFQDLISSSGMFALLPFSSEQIQNLRDKHAIYLSQNGRINFAGLNTADIEAIAESFKDVL